MRIATYNLYNCFLCGEGYAKSGKAVSALRHMIARVDADVMVVQEVGSQASLDALNQALANPYAFCEARAGNSNRGIALGVLSRYPVAVGSHADAVLEDADGAPIPCFWSEADARANRLSQLKMQRDVLEVRLAVNATPLVLLGVHLKSRANMDWQTVAADTIRAAEARYVAGLARAHSAAGAHVVVLGDMNDVVGAKPLEALEATDLSDPHGASLRRLGRNPSTYWPKRRMRIDRILTSPSLAPHVVADSPQIHNGHRAQVASDHYPVSLDFVDLV